MEPASSAMSLKTVGDGRAGRVGVDDQPGHPHGFHHHVDTGMGEIAEREVLQDPAGVLTAMKELAGGYPEGPRRGLVERHLWEASFTLETIARSPKRGDVAYTSGRISRSASPPRSGGSAPRPNRSPRASR